MDTNSIFGGEGLIILILFFLMMGGNAWGGNNRGEYATSQQLYETANANGVNAKIDNISQAINNSVFQQMQSTANVTQALNTGFDQINANISQLGYQMSQCCCSIKEQLLQDKYEAVSRELNVAVNASANAVQTQNILSALGRFVPYATIGTTTV